LIDGDIAKLGLFGSFPPLKFLTAPGAAAHPWRLSAGIISLFCKAFPALSLVVPYIVDFLPCCCGSYL